MPEVGSPFPHSLRSLPPQQLVSESVALLALGAVPAPRAAVRLPLRVEDAEPLSQLRVLECRRVGHTDTLRESRIMPAAAIILADSASQIGRAAMLARLAVGRVIR